MVSVIVAIYNVEEYLPSCLDSVLGQTHSDLEIICVNDGSKDRCATILQEYADKDSRIRIINKPNGGLSDARNAGMEVASGAFFAFLDGDDTYERNLIEKLFNSQQKTSSDLACCNYAYSWPEEKRKEPRPLLTGLPEVLNQKESIRAYLNQKIVGSAVIKLYKKSICADFNLRFPKGQLWEDMTFTLNYLQHVDKVSIVHEELYNYRQTRESISRTINTLNILDQLLAVNAGIEKIKADYPGEFEKEMTTYLTRGFICVLVYSFKCTDKEILKKILLALKNESGNVGFYGLNLQEKAMLLLYKINYNLVRFTFLKIYKRNATT